MNEMNENSQIEVDLCTPTENLKKHCQEITPDNPTKPEKRPVLAAKKVLIPNPSSLGCSQYNSDSPPPSPQEFFIVSTLKCDALIPQIEKLDIAMYITVC